MAILLWDEPNSKLLVNTHVMSGKPLSIPFDDTYSVSIDTERGEGISTALSGAFGTHEVYVAGAPWDYALSEMPSLHEGSYIGHYRAIIEGMDDDVIASVNLHDGERVIQCGAEVFEVYKKNGIDVAGSPVSFPGGGFTIPVGDNFMHLEKHSPGKMLANSTLDGRQAELGRLVGKIYTANKLMSDDLKARLQKSTRETTLAAVAMGFKAFQGDGSVLETLKTELLKRGDIQSSDELSALFDSISGDVLRVVPRVLESSVSVSNHFNLIEKMIVDNPDSSLALKDFDGPTIGYFPMMTENATHDVGNALWRIVSDPKRYEGEDIEGQICAGFGAFIEGYNQETELSLTREEALQASRNVMAFNAAYSFGYPELEGKGAIKVSDLVEHFVTTAIPNYKRFEQLQAVVLEV